MVIGHLCETTRDRDHIVATIIEHGYILLVAVERKGTEMDMPVFELLLTCREIDAFDEDYNDIAHAYYQAHMTNAFVSDDCAYDDVVWC